MRRQIRFLTALWKANLLSAMEYRASFISQTVGMMLNNLIYFLFWVLFFDRFDQVRGWGLNEMMVLFGLVAASFGLSMLFFGNVIALADVIASGKLDYYLSLPRPVLLHVLASSSRPSGLGDFLYGCLSFAFAGGLTGGSLVRFFVGVILSTCIFLGFLILVQSLSFWLGNSQLLTTQSFNAMITFSIYPLSLFDTSAKLLLFTVLPAALVGALPAEFVMHFSWSQLIILLLASAGFLLLSGLVFQRGLRRYESGSAIHAKL
jgi:ABC-2 type transport system permease protein